MGIYSEKQQEMRGKLELDTSDLAREFARVLNALSKAFKTVDNFRESIKEASIWDTITYDDALKYFVNSRPQDSKIAKGAIITKKCNGFIEFYQVFLNKGNDIVYSIDNIPYGRRLTVKNIDSELKELFGNGNVLIVE